jgi:hypothetical protein
MKDYEIKYEEFWKNIIEEDGVFDMEQVKKELYDYSLILSSVSKVYCAVTGGQISKANADPDAVISLFNKKIEDEINEAIKDERDMIRELEEWQ